MILSINFTLSVDLTIGSMKKSDHDKEGKSYS